jgi:uncharacterized protein
MKQDLARDLTDSELDELARLLEATPAPLRPLDVLMLDGYLAGVLVQPRLIGIEESLPPIFDVERRALPDTADPVWRASVSALIGRRRDALNAGISEDGFFDPVIVDVDQLPPASEYEAVQSPVSRALLPWAAGFQWAQDCFTELEHTANPAIAAALSRIYRHLPPQDEDDKALLATLERDHPLTDLDVGIEDLVNATVELWDLTAKVRYAVAPLRRQAPKVGRNDPCPCGSGKKFKTCHGKQ